jgi:hypothetical protein
MEFCFFGETEKNPNNMTESVLKAAEYIGVILKRMV